MAILAGEAVMGGAACVDPATLAALLPLRLDLPDGKADLRSLPATGGVYLLCDAEERPVLLAGAEDLRHAVGQRLSAPAEEKSRRANLAEVVRQVRWRGTFSRFETAWAHWRVARVLNRGAYRKNLMFGHCWFVRVQLADAAPRLTATKEYRPDGAKYLGPIATRAAAEAWIHMLEDAFDLCRYHEVLAQSPHGQACSYFDMGKCAAPCNGSMPMEAYRDALRDAVAFSTGHVDGRVGLLQARMREASSLMQFERAAGIKQTIERAERLPAREEYRQLCDVAEVGWLVIQRAGPSRKRIEDQLFHGFLVMRGRAVWSTPISLGELETRADAWLGELASTAGREDLDAAGQCEMLWLVAKFLFEGDRAPGVYFRADMLPEGRRLVEAIRGRYAAAEGAESGESEAT